MFSELPTGRRIAMTALVSFCSAILLVTLIGGLSDMYAVRLMQVIACVLAGIVVLAAIMVVVTGRLAHYTSPEDEEEFEQLVRHSERLARENLAAEPDEGEFLERDPHDPADFEELVREALDDLPDLLRATLDRVAVVISDRGWRERAYGLYQGGSMARDD